MSSLQEERSAETRRRLLDATVECLYERGYSGTTTTEIASRAGVSRGAQLHHFPKKDELVVSALEHVFAMRLAELGNAVAEPPPGDREARLEALIDKMWPFFKGPTFYAWLELVVASRTEPALNEAVRAASQRFSEGFVRGVGVVLVLPEGHEVELMEILSTIFAHLESMALERILSPDDQVDSPASRNSLETLKKIAVALLRGINSSVSKSTAEA